MRVKLDEYSQYGDRIRCTAITEDGQYTFYWEPSVGVTPEAGMDNQRTNLSLRERLEAAGRAKVIHRMIYDLNQNL